MFMIWKFTWHIMTSSIAAIWTAYENGLVHENDIPGTHLDLTKKSLAYTGSSRLRHCLGQLLSLFHGFFLLVNQFNSIYLASAKYTFGANKSTKRHFSWELPCEVCGIVQSMARKEEISICNAIHIALSTNPLVDG